METIEFKVNYRGAAIEAKIFPDENYLGLIYPVELNDHYTFTIYLNENEEWLIMREGNGITPTIDNELLSNILKKLQWQLKYAA